MPAEFDDKYYLDCRHALYANVASNAALVRLHMNKLKHWQLFGIFLIPVFIGFLIDNGFYKGLINSLSMTFVIIYCYSIGDYLNQFNKLRGYALFRFNCVYLLVVTILFPNGFESIIGDNIFLVMAILSYSLLAFIQVAEHLAILLRKVEKKKVDEYKQSGEFILFFIWPIGVWFLQPRINNIG